MTPAFDKLHQALKRLPGLGARSAERLALHLLVERPQRARELSEAIQDAVESLGRCTRCGNLAEGPQCRICQNPQRREEALCVVETVTDLMAIERAGSWDGLYHVLHGKLSPVQGIGPEDLNLAALRRRLEAEPVQEVLLALSNDLEGEATCHYIQEQLPGQGAPRVTRIGFGLPSGGGLMYADPATLQSALNARRDFT